MSLRRLAVAAGLVLSLCGAAAAQEATKIRFTLDWKLQGIHAWYIWARILSGAYGTISAASN